MAIRRFTAITAVLSVTASPLQALATTPPANGPSVSATSSAEITSAYRWDWSLNPDTDAVNASRLQSDDGAASIWPQFVFRANTDKSVAVLQTKNQVVVQVHNGSDTGHDVTATVSATSKTFGDCVVHENGDALAEEVTVAPGDEKSATFDCGPQGSTGGTSTTADKMRAATDDDVTYTVRYKDGGLNPVTGTTGLSIDETIKQRSLIVLNTLNNFGQNTFRIDRNEPMPVERRIATPDRITAPRGQCRQYEYVSELVPKITFGEGVRGIVTKENDHPRAAVTVCAPEMEATATASAAGTDDVDWDMTTGFKRALLTKQDDGTYSATTQWETITTEGQRTLTATYGGTIEYQNLNRTFPDRVDFKKSYQYPQSDENTNRVVSTPVGDVTVAGVKVTSLTPGITCAASDNAIGTTVTTGNTAEIPFTCSAPAGVPLPPFDSLQYTITGSTSDGSRSTSQGSLSVTADLKESGQTVTLTDGSTGQTVTYVPSREEARHVEWSTVVDQVTGLKPGECREVTHQMTLSKQGENEAPTPVTATGTVCAPQSGEDKVEAPKLGLRAEAPTNTWAPGSTHAVDVTMSNDSEETVGDIHLALTSPDDSRPQVPATATCRAGDTTATWRAESATEPLRDADGQAVSLRPGQSLRCSLNVVASSEDGAAFTLNASATALGTVNGARATATADTFTARVAQAEEAAIEVALYSVDPEAGNSSASAVVAALGEQVPVTMKLTNGTKPLEKVATQITGSPQVDAAALAWESTSPWHTSSHALPGDILRLGADGQAHISADEQLAPIVLDPGQVVTASGATGPLTVSAEATQIKATVTGSTAAGSAVWASAPLWLRADASTTPDTPTATEPTATNPTSTPTTGVMDVEDDGTVQPASGSSGSAAGSATTGGSNRAGSAVTSSDLWPWILAIVTVVGLPAITGHLTALRLPPGPPLPNIIALLFPQRERPATTTPTPTPAP